MMTKPLEILLGIVSAAGKRGLPLTFAVKQAEEKMRSDGYSNPAETTQTAIREGLESCVIDKIIDEPESEEESADLRPIWLLRILSPEESRALRELPPVERALLRTLRESEWDGDIGVIRESVALEKLREQGFDVEYVPFVLGRTGSSFRSKNGEPVTCHHLLSEYERSDAFKEAQKELEEIAERQAHLIDVRLARGMHEEAAREKRKAARKKKAAVIKKKSSAKKKAMTGTMD
jgi:hypothetical protein